MASNQVQYSLLYREPERNGVKKAIEDVGATLVAYSPLNQGLLTGQPSDCPSPLQRSGLLHLEHLKVCVE